MAGGGVALIGMTLVPLLSGLFDSINGKVSEIASTIGTTPHAWDVCYEGW